MTEQEDHQQQLEAQTQELQEKTRQLQDVVDSVQVALWLRHPETGYLLMNQNHRDLFGIDSEEDVVGKAFEELLPEDVAAILRINDERARDAREPIEIVEEVPTDEGVRTFLTRITPLFDDNGDFYASCGVATDITEQKEQEQQLEAERRRFRSLVDVLPHGVYRGDPDTLKTIFVNEAHKQIHGYTADAWSDSSDLWRQSLHPDDAPRILDAFQSHRESREPGQLEYRIQTKDGETRWVEDTFQWEFDDEEDITALVGVYTDITERKEQHAALRERNKELEALHYTAELFARPDVPIEALMNEFVEEIPNWFQYPEHTHARVSFADIDVSTDGFEPADSNIATTIESQEGTTVTIEIGHSSETQPIEFLEEERELIRTIITSLAETVDRHYHAERSNLFQRAADASGHAVVITDSDGVIKYVNPAYEAQTGFTQAEAIGSTPRIVKSGKHDPVFYEDLWETILRGEEWHSELINRRKDGTHYHADQVISPIVDANDDITHFVAIEADITERRVREQQLDVLNRILRHNLRNRLTVIGGHSTIIQDASDDETVAKSTDVIDEEVDGLIRTAEKTSRSQNLLEDRDLSDSNCDLGALLQQLEAEVKDEYDGVEFSFDYPSTVLVHGDDRLGWAIEEAVENAVVHNDHSQPEVSVSVNTPNDGIADTVVEVTIADNGPGIPEDQRTVIETGEETPLEHGTGIGLWNMYWIVTSVGGEIRIEDRPPRGSEVILGLPILRNHD